MSPAKILALRRQAQIAEMEGRDGAGITAEQAQKAARAIETPKQKRYRPPKRVRLLFTPHARRRMAQRGMSAADVDVLWRFGEAMASGRDTVYQATERAISEARDASPRYGEHLRGLAGAAIVGVDRDSLGCYRKGNY